MKHEIRQEGAALVAVIQGDVDMQSSPQARKTLLECVGKSNRVVVDLSGVGYMDSSGVASLVEAYQGAKKKGGKLVLAAVSDSVMKVLKLARLEMIFTIAPSVAAGLDA